jgi:hypothetical protein
MSGAFRLIDITRRNMDNLNALVSWVIWSGGALLIASWVLDKIPAFAKLSSDWKKYVNMAVSVFLALAAYAVITYVPASVYATLDPWFKIVACVIALYSGQQVVHNQTKFDDVVVPPVVPPAA